MQENEKKNSYYKVVRMIKEEFEVYAADKKDAENQVFLNGDPSKCTITSIKTTKIK